MTNSPPSTPTASIEIVLNGSARTVRAALPLEHLIAELAPASTQGLAVAVNDAVVPRAQWTRRCLQPHDVVEIVRAARGG
ncbi:MAG: sulfur carrier protein ThiS [Alphaproteobacteria bacterium]|nr:sulfur carrier protein ThiS [Alphaproteobacteria bacterium]